MHAIARLCLAGYIDNIQVGALQLTRPQADLPAHVVLERA